MTDIPAILAERGNVHGYYPDQAANAQALKFVLRQGLHWDDLNSAQRDALEMIAAKISRILTGDPNHRDHWDDIAGYASLVSRHLADRTWQGG